MKRLIHRAIPFVILFLMFPAKGWADDDPLPADFGDILEDNPTDAPIVSILFTLLILGMIFKYTFPKFRNIK